MKKYLITFLLVLTAAKAGLASPRANSVQITLDDVVKRVSTTNFNVYANALRVYQAREGIQVARMNLLPRLNLWRVADVAVESAMGNPSSVIGLVQDIAPFLVPANWFRINAAKELYLAEKEGYRALWANELMTAKALYVHLLLDRSLLDHLKQSEQELLDLLVLVGSREMMGGAPQGSSREIEIRLLGLREDIRAVEVMLDEEESLLAYMMGLPAEAQIKLAPIEFPEFDGFDSLDYADFEFRAVDSAPEIRQFNHFIAASGTLRKEVMFSFLGTGSVSRGVAGGIFDGIPIQDGLGFGAPASLRIIGAEQALLGVQRDGIQETVKRHLKLLVNTYNLDLENYSGLKRRVELTTAAQAQLFERLELGQEVAMIDLIEASRNHIQADTALFAVKYRFVTNEDKLSRLIFHGDYTKKPIEIESLKKQGRRQ